MIVVRPVSADQSTSGERRATNGEPIVDAMHWLASIPSPSSGSLELGPLRLNAYGLMIALGAVAATWLVGRRLEARKWGTRDDASSIAIWAVPAGVVGARIYHVITDWDRFDGRLVDTVKIWKGGLGIWGGLVLGTIVGLWIARRRGLNVAQMLTVVAPALPLAQAIGRWGNWFNQELFGRPTTLPWGLEIDAQNVPEGYDPGTLFHPTFLYESLGCLALVAILIWIDRRTTLQPGRLFLFYTGGYALLRFFVEGLRIDPASSAGGLRLNQWVSIVVFVVSVGAFIALQRRKKSTV
jgi:prolipoprotein diacylglyceryl transferase